MPMKGANTKNNDPVNLLINLSKMLINMAVLRDKPPPRSK